LLVDLIKLGHGIATDAAPLGPRRDRRNEAPEPTTRVSTARDAQNGSPGANRNLHEELINLDKSFSVNIITYIY
jgi:hypothetical protein